MKPNPLVDALRGREKAPPKFELPPMARTLQLEPKDLPDLKNMKPGQALTVVVSGKIRSVNDGQAVMEVMMIEPEEDDNEQPPIVTTQDSPSPGGA